MKLQELIQQTNIVDVFQELGGTVQGRRDAQTVRGNAFWRNSKDKNICLYTRKGFYYDTVADEGGGLIKLIMTAKGASKAEAAAWLERYAGVQLGSPDRKAGDEMRDAETWRARKAFEAGEMSSVFARLQDAIARQSHDCLNDKRWRACAKQQYIHQAEYEMFRDLSGRELLEAYRNRSTTFPRTAVKQLAYRGSIVILIGLIAIGIDQFFS